MSDVCSIEDCGKPRAARGWCQMHYRRWKNHGDTSIVLPSVGSTRPRRVGIEPCSIDGCEKPMRAREWCVAHWTRWKRHGSPTARLRGEVIDGRRVCPGCGQDKPVADYAATMTRCRVCVAEKTARRTALHPYQPIVGEPRECDNCGATFMANARRSRYCRVECYSAHKNQANWKHLVARRARLAEAWVETFDRFEIFERDGWVCQICLVEIDRNLSHPDPGSASLDHIVPVSRGGEHSRANAQASHLYCNTVKGARALEEVG